MWSAPISLLYPGLALVNVTRYVLAVRARAVCGARADGGTCMQVQ